jgi:hypothetical protein
MRNLKDSTLEDEDDYDFVVRIDRRAGNSVQCPGCKKRTNLSSGKVEDIPKNFAYINLLDRMREMEGVKRDSKKKSCSVHDGEDLRYWCFQPGCNKAVCSSCLLEGNHRNHEFKPLTMVCRAKRQELVGKLQLAEEQTKVVQEGFEKIKEEMNRLSTLADSTKRKIQDKFEEMRMALKEREKELIEEIEGRMEDSSYILDSQKQAVEEALQRGTKVCKEMRGVVEGHDLDVLKNYSETSSSLGELAASLADVPLDILVKVQIRFSQTQGVLKELRNYGKLLFEEPQPPPPQMGKESFTIYNVNSSTTSKPSSIEADDPASYYAKQESPPSIRRETPPSIRQGTPPSSSPISTGREYPLVEEDLPPSLSDPSPSPRLGQKPLSIEHVDFVESERQRTASSASMRVGRTPTHSSPNHTGDRTRQDDRMTRLAKMTVTGKSEYKPIIPRKQETTASRIIKRLSEEDKHSYPHNMEEPDPLDLSGDSVADLSSSRLSRMTRPDHDLPASLQLDKKDLQHSREPEENTSLWEAAEKRCSSNHSGSYGREQVVPDRIHTVSETGSDQEV